MKTLTLNDCHTFPPFLRTLLWGDGTVSLALELFYQQPIRAEVQEEQRETSILRTTCLWLDNTCVVFARAEIILPFLPPNLSLHHPKGIGEALRAANLPTFRALEHIFTPDVSLLPPSITQFSNEWVARSYRIFCPTPAFAITEYFPVDWYRHRG